MKTVKARYGLVAHDFIYIQTPQKHPKTTLAYAVSPFPRKHQRGMCRIPGTLPRHRGIFSALTLGEQKQDSSNIFPLETRHINTF